MAYFGRRKMKNPTIEEMVKALDGKFEGFKYAIRRNDQSVGYTQDICGNYQIVLFNIFKSSFIKISICMHSEGITFHDISMEKAIAKAYDYFIVKGGEL